MSTKMIQIQANPHPTPTQPAMFVPASVVANVGDNLTWHNADKQDHWPAPSASNPTGFVQFRIPPDGTSRGDLALAANIVAVTGATNAAAVVLTLNGAAPPTGTKVTMTYFPPPAPPGTTPPTSPWSGVSGSFVATNLGPNRCSIPVNTSSFPPLTPSQGSLTLTSPLPYTLKYVCALHKDELGAITVNPQA